MSLTDRLLSKDASKLKRIVLILSSISLIMYLMIGLMGEINSLNWFPFGWTYDIVFSNKIISGKIHSLEQNACQKQIFARIKNVKKSKFMTFKTIVYSNADQNYQFYLSGPHKGRIFCNGKPGKITINKHKRIILLKKGYNKIEVRYTHKRGWSKFFLKFYKKGRIHSRRLPFYHYILPGSSLSKLFFHLLQFFDHYIKPIGFIVALVLMIFLFPLVFTQKKSVSKPVVKKLGLGFMVFEYFCFGMAIMFSIIFINNRLHLKIPSLVIWFVPLLIPIINLIKTPGIKICLKMDLKKIAILFLIATLIFGYLYKLSGQIIPMKTIGKIDLISHMKMVNHFKQYNEIKTDHDREIYPQSFHAFLSMASDILKIYPGKIVTLFLAITFILVYFLIFLLSKHFFPDSGPVPFFLIIIPANFSFILDSVFRTSYFTPIISIFFFLSALFFFFHERMIPSSVMLAVSLITYPFFMGIFLITMFFLFMNRLLILQSKRSQKMIQFGLFFLLPFLFATIYTIIYISFGFNQPKAGFSYFFKLNPFTDLGPLNSFAILIGISYLFSSMKKNRNLLILVFATVFGFLVYYIPHVFFNLGSTYYLIKIINYLMLFGIILEIHALNSIYLWLKKSKLSLLLKKQKMDRCVQK